MSGQYPTGFNNQVGGHRGNFNNPMMNQMNMLPQQQQQMGGMMGGFQQGGMMQSPQHQSAMQGPTMGGGMNLPNPAMMQQGGGPTGMQSPSHTPQQQVNPQQQQQQLTQQPQQTPPQPQLNLTTPTTPSTGNVPSMLSNPSVGVQGPAGVPPPGGPNPQQHKEFNIVSLCRFGQETVQDIVSRFQEVFQALRQIQLPNGINSTSTEKKVQEHFRTIRLLFKRVRILYDKCNECCQQGMEYTHVESLIPLKDDPDHKPEPAPSEEYKKALQENRELIETAMLKNKQLREVIDRMRIIIWEINTMLSMRKS